MQSWAQHPGSILCVAGCGDSSLCLTGFRQSSSYLAGFRNNSLYLSVFGAAACIWVGSGAAAHVWLGSVAVVYIWLLLLVLGLFFLSSFFLQSMTFFPLSCMHYCQNDDSGCYIAIVVNCHQLMTTAIQKNYYRILPEMFLHCHR